MNKRTLAFLGLIWPSLYAHALTLSEAINQQLASDPLPCEQLLGDDNSAVLVGNLAGVICARAVPLGSTPQATTGSDTRPINLSSRMEDNQQASRREEHSTQQQISAKLRVFATAESESLDKDVSVQEDGFDSDALRLIVGATYSLQTNIDLTASLISQQHDGDFSNGGDFKTRSNGYRVLMEYRPSAEFFFIALAGQDFLDAQRSRNVQFNEFFNSGLVFSQSGTPAADFDYQQSEIGLLSGYNIQRGNITLTPQIGLNWITSDFGTYSESGDSGLELTVHNDERTSLQSVLGLQGSMAIGTRIGAVIPQFHLRWKHEFEDKSRRVNVSFVDDTRAKQFYFDSQAGDRDFYEAGLGSVFIFAKGIQAFLRIQTLLEHDYYQSTLVSVGTVMEF